jgi:hypothetical protein
MGPPLVTAVEARSPSQLYPSGEILLDISVRGLGTLTNARIGLRFRTNGLPRPILSRCFHFSPISKASAAVATRQGPGTCARNGDRSIGRVGTQPGGQTRRGASGRTLPCAAHCQAPGVAALQTGRTHQDRWGDVAPCLHLTRACKRSLHLWSGARRHERTETVRHESVLIVRKRTKLCLACSALVASH